MMKKKDKIYNSLPTLRSIKQERIFWVTFTFIWLALFLVFSFLSARQGNSMPFITKILWIVFIIIPPLFLTIRSFIAIEQINTFEDHFVLQHGTITGHHKEDSDLGKQPFAMLYWVYFKVNGDFVFKQQVSLAAYNQLKVGDQIIVKVSPNKPRLCRAEIE